MGLEGAEKDESDTLLTLAEASVYIVILIKGSLNITINLLIVLEFP